MKKDEILEQIKDLASEHSITKEEIVAAYNEGAKIKTDRVFTRKVGIAEILYCIGGAIVFIGISILIWGNWSRLGIVTKILATLGAGIAAYIVGILCSRDEKLESVGSAFYLISALVMPLGLYVVFDIAGFDAGSYGIQSLNSGILFITYLLSYFVFRKNVFTLFNILFGTWLFFSFTSFLVGTNPSFSAVKFYEYRALVVGLAYILLGYFFSQDEKAPLSGFLYGFGILGFLGAAFALGGWSPKQNAFWELIFPALTFGAIILSIRLKSKAFLTFGTLYLIGYILKITAEYFRNTLGWPLALVLVGLMIIAIGYTSFYLNKKYIVNPL